MSERKPESDTEAHDAAAKDEASNEENAEVEEGESSVIITTEHSNDTRQLEDQPNPFGLLLGSGPTSTSQDSVEMQSLPEDSSFKRECLLDSDSGIEAMEAEETDGTKASVDFRVEEVRQSLLHIFAMSLDPHEGELYLPLVASTIREIDETILRDSGTMQSAVSTIITEILVKINTSSESLTVGGRAAQDSLGCSPSREFSVGSCSSGGGTLLQSNHLVNEVDASNGSRSLLLFRYLLNCFGRLKSREHASSVEEIDGLSELLFEVSRQLLRQAFLVASGAYDTSSDGNAHKAVLLRHIVVSALPSGFLDALIAQIDADGDSGLFDEVFRPVLDSFIRVLNLCSLSSDEFRQPLSMLKELCQLKTSSRRLFCDMLVRQPDWIPASVSEAAGRELSRFSILGAPLGLSALVEDDPRVQDKYFVDGEAITPEAQAHFSQTIRRLIGILREDVHEIIFNVVANASSREKAMEFISEIIKRNAEKAKLWVEPSKLCTDGFALNLLAVMYRLSLKITVDKVNALYPFYSASKVDITQASRLKLSSNEAEEFAQSLSNKAADIKFPTECFFLTLHMQHISLTPAIERYGEQLRRQSQVNREITNLERTEHVWGNTPQAPRNHHSIRMHKALMMKMLRSRACAESILFDESLLGAAFQFCTKTLSLLAQVARSSGQDFPLPLPANKLFAALPEFYLEDALDIFIFTLKYAPKVVSEDPCSFDFVPAFLTFLCSPNSFNKPFLAAKLVEAMFLTGQQAQDRLYKSLLIHPIANTALFRSLVKFYSDCEFTGSHTEFYDKFTIRYNIQIIFKTMWQDVIHQSIMIEQCGECGLEFIRFVNMLINDTTFLLDEALDGLKRIHETQELRKNTDAWSSLQADEQTQRESRLAQDEGSVRSYMQLAKETLELFCYLTKKVQEPFLSAQIGSRLAAMLNSNLLQLCGPKCSKLKVTDAKKYSFNPKSLLNSLTDIYLHLDSQRFWDFLASDERSYSKDLFDSVTSRLKQSSIKPQPQIEAFELLAERVFGIWKTNLQQEEDLGDIPDEFLDPIMGTLMRDPVRLPSGHIMDRNVILTHLFNDQKNPFNREPLSADNLEDASELRRRVEEWVADKRKQSQRPKAS